MKREQKNKNSFLINLFLLLTGAFLFASSHPGLFFKNGNSYLAFFSLCPVFLICKKNSTKTSALWGVIYGLFSYSLFAFWLFAYEKTAFFAVLFLCALQHALFFAILSSFSRLTSAPFLAMALLWPFFEFCKTSGELGFSYGVIGYSQWTSDFFLKLSAVGGVWASSLFISFTSAFISSLLNNKFFFFYSDSHLKQTTCCHSYKESFFIAAFAIIFLLFSYPFIRLYEKNLSDTSPRKKSLNILLVQNNTDSNKYGIDVYKRDLSTLMDLTKKALLLHPETELVVWPETAVVPPVCENYYSQKNNERKVLIEELLTFIEESKVPFVIGNQHRENGLDFNAALFFSSQNQNVVPPEPLVYAKKHLVPFAETFPFAEYFPSVNKKILSNARYWARGKNDTLFNIKNISFATPICFEDTFPADCRTFVKEGAELLVNLSNDSWSKSLSSQSQHLSMACFRAAENALPMVRSTGNGITCAISPSGKIISSCPPFTEACVYAQVQVKAFKTETFYTKHGDWLPLVCFFMCLFFLLIPSSFKNRNR